MKKTLTSIREDLSGKKTFALIGFAIITILGQYMFSVDFGVPALPMATNLGELAQQVYGFALAGTFRAAMN